MRRKASGSRIRITGLSAAALLCPLGSLDASAAEMVECDGYLVPDSVEISGTLQYELDTLSDSQMANVDIDFKIVESRYTDRFDTLPWNMYTLWSERLFSENELFRSPNTPRLTPGLLEIMPGYTFIFATKETILELSKACYVSRIIKHFPPISSTVHSIKSTSEQKEAEKFFDALGRRPEYPGKPWRPGMAPTFSPPAQSAK